MPQLAVRYNPAVGGLDLVKRGSSHVLDEGYLTAEILSVKIEARASVRGGPPRGGWWANPILGSKLWALLGDKIDDTFAARVRTELIATFQWMVDAKICRKIEATAVAKSNTVTGTVTLHRRAESLTEVRRWELSAGEFTYA
jgi:phage gp46-like protein